MTEEEPIPVAEPKPKPGRWITIGRFFFVLYPFVVLAIVLTLFPRWASAGQMRKLVLPPDRPGIINLAYGNKTAVSFQSKPQHLVPGAPERVDINFMGNDLTISALSANPGNLLVYTSNGARYVLLFHVVPEAKHDDVVEIISAERPNSKPMRLDRDSYKVEKLKVIVKPKTFWGSTKVSEVSAVTYSERLLGDELSDLLKSFKRLRCEKCVLNAKPTDPGLVCKGAISYPIKCTSDDSKGIEISRGGP